MIDFPEKTRECKQERYCYYIAYVFANDDGFVFSAGMLAANQTFHR
jgi:hypothetical protein